MIEIKDKSFIMDFLKEEDEISNLNLIGAIKNIDGTLFANPKDEVAIFVDDLKNPKGVIVREHEYWHYVYSKEDNFLDQAYDSYFSHLEDYGFDAVDMHVYDYFKSKGVLDWDEPCYLYYISRETQVSYSPQVEISDISLDHVDLINDLYTFKDEFSRVFIEDNIKNRPSCCYIFDGKPVSWVMVHRDNSMGVMYTKKEHRNKNLAYELSMALIQKILEKNDIPYVHIGTENQASQKLAEKCGFVRYKPIMWFGMKGKKDD